MRYLQNNFLNKQIAGLSIVLLLTVAFYWQGLSGPLILDDYPQLGEFFDNENLASSELENAVVSESGRLGRSVSMVTFIGNYLHSGNDLFDWKLTNLILHLVCGVILFMFLRAVQEAVNIRFGCKYRYLPLIAVSIWLLHPLQVSTVLYLVQRMAQLSTLFMGLGLYLYTSARLQQLCGGTAMPRLWSSVILFLPLAVLSKENGALLPVLILAVEFFVFGFQQRPELKRTFSWFLGICIALPLLAGVLILLAGMDSLVLNGYAGRTFSFTQRLLTESRVLTMHLTQMLWPDISSMPFFYENYPVSKSLLHPLETILSILFILGLIISAWILRVRQPLFALGIFFYFAAMSMESSIFPLELVFEHRNYLGLIGIAIALYSLVYHGIGKTGFRVTIYVATVMVLSTATIARASIWSSKTDFYNYVYKQNPTSPRINAVLAEELTRQKKHGLAIQLLDNIDDNGARLQQMYIRCHRGDDLSKIDYTKLAHKIESPVDGYAVTGLIELANMGLDKKCAINYEGYDTFLEKVLINAFRKSNDKPKVALYRAHFLWEQHKRDEAFEFLESLSKQLEDNPIPLFLATEWALDVGDKKKAEKYYRRAKAIAEGSSKNYTLYEESIDARLDKMNEKKYSDHG